MTENFTLHGYDFIATCEPDDYSSEPWNEYDGNGIISEWRPKDSKRPGERILHQDRRSCLFYDWAGTMEKAKREGWGCAHEHATAGERRACAVQADFDRWRRYCDGQWSYVFVVVRLADDPRERESLGGIESDCTDHIEETARELAAEILSRVEVDDPQIQVSEN
jgi:hypothetical protein